MALRQQCNALSSPDWLLPWWHWFGREDLRAVTIWQEGELIGLLPFYIHADSQSGKRQLQLIGAGTSDYLDGIFASSCTPEDVRRAVNLLTHEGDWDVGYAVQLRGSSKLLKALAVECRPRQTDSCFRMPAVPASGLPPKLRQNLQYRRRRAARLGAIEFIQAGEQNCLQLLDALVRLQSERWHNRPEPAVFSDPRVVIWHRETVPLLARDGLLRFHALSHNGEILAAVFALADPPEHPTRSLSIYLPSFSPRFAEISPGMLILAHAIEQAASEGIQTIDMLRGEESYKQLWHTQRASTWGVELLPAEGAISSRLIQAA